MGSVVVVLLYVGCFVCCVSWNGFWFCVRCNVCLIDWRVVFTMWIGMGAVASVWMRASGSFGCVVL